MPLASTQTTSNNTPNNAKALRKGQAHFYSSGDEAPDLGLKRFPFRPRSGGLGLASGRLQRGSASRNGSGRQSAGTLAQRWSGWPPASGDRVEARVSVDLEHAAPSGRAAEARRPGWQTAPSVTEHLRVATPSRSSTPSETHALPRPGPGLRHPADRRRRSRAVAPNQHRHRTPWRQARRPRARTRTARRTCSRNTPDSARAVVRSPAPPRHDDYSRAEIHPHAHSDHNQRHGGSQEAPRERLKPPIAAHASPLGARPSRRRAV